MRSRNNSPEPRRPVRTLIVGAVSGLGIGFLFGLVEILLRPLPLSPFVAIAAPFYGAAGVVFGIGSAVAVFFFPRRIRRVPFVVAGTILAFPVAANLLRITFEHLPHGIAPSTIAALLAAAIVWLALSILGGRLLCRLPERALTGATGIAAAAALLLILFGSPERRTEIDGPALEGRPNVLFILIDTLRADHLGLYGYPRATSPRIDRLARDGVQFTHAFSQCSWTKPSVVSILSARYPFSFSRTDLYHSVPESARLLPEIFAEGGYRTGAIVANPIISPSFGFGQGFETFDHGYLSLSALRIYRYMLWLDLLTHPRLMFRGDVLADRAIDWLGEHGGEPFFLYLHFMDPHEAYDPGEPYDRLFRDRPLRGKKTLIYPRPRALPFDGVDGNPYGDDYLRELVDRYDGEVRRTDREIGRVIDELQRLGLYENTAVVVIADHGEEFLEHGGWGHGQSLYAELTNVPFVIKGPGVAAPRDAVDARRVMMIDVGPTLLRFCGIGADAPLDGVDLFGAAGERAAVADVSAGEARIASVRRGDYHYVVAERNDTVWAQLFHLGIDPAESADRIGDDPEAAAALAAFLDSLIAATETLEAGEMPLDEGLVEQLRDLGYIE